MVVGITDMSCSREEDKARIESDKPAPCDGVCRGNNNLRVAIISLLPSSAKIRYDRKHSW